MTHPKESPEAQVRRLASFLLSSVPTAPEDGLAVDRAIRTIRDLQAWNRELHAMLAEYFETAEVSR